MTRYRNLLSFLVLAAVWGSAFMAIEAGLEFFPPVLLAAVRYDVAGVVMLAYAARVLDDPFPRGRGQWALVVVGSVLLIAGYHAFLFVGQTDPGVTSASAAVIVSLSPLLTTGFARLLLPGERLELLGVVGLLFGLAGAVVLADPDPSNLLAGGAAAKLLVLLAAASFALGSVLTRAIEGHLPIESMQAWSMLGGAVLLHVVSVFLGESAREVVWSTDAVLSLAYLSLAASAAGFLLYFDLLERLGPVEINLVSYVSPVFAALSGVLVLSETVSVSTVEGFVLVVVGFALLKRKALRTELARYRRDSHPN